MAMKKSPHGQMHQKMVLDMDPTPENGRNSEGSFLRAPDGRILFAYSHYMTGDSEDNAPCDIWMISSADEGETWSQPCCIVKAADLGVENVMSVSGTVLRDGRLCFFFMIKENDNVFSSSIGRAVSSDGIHFEVSRSVMKTQKNYYVIANDRVIRLHDGRLLLPASCHQLNENYDGTPYTDYSLLHGEAVCFVSGDDGISFSMLPARATTLCRLNRSCGLQEPGVLQRSNGVLWFWARTVLHCQYEWYSLDNAVSFTTPEPSIFTSPCSPMSIRIGPDGCWYAVYNPVPHYNGSADRRNPLVLRRSRDEGKNWGSLNVLEEDPSRGFCYTAMFFTNDGGMLLAYCRGSYETDGNELSRLGIRKVRVDSIRD